MYCHFCKNKIYLSIYLHFSNADILVSQVGDAGGSPTQCQITVEYTVLDATILYTVHMTQPSQSALSEQMVHTGKASTREGISIGLIVSPGFDQVTTDASRVV